MFFSLIFCFIFSIFQFIYLDRFGESLYLFFHISYTNSGQPYREVTYIYKIVNLVNQNRVYQIIYHQTLYNFLNSFRLIGWANCLLINHLARRVASKGIHTIRRESTRSILKSYRLLLVSWLTAISSEKSQHLFHKTENFSFT